MASARVAGRTSTAVIASVLTTALQFSEGPVWLGAEQAIGHGFGRGAGLLFSDIDASKQYMLCDGRLRVVRSNSNGANGNAISADGALLTANINPGGSFASIQCENPSPLSKGSRAPG